VIFFYYGFGLAFGIALSIAVGSAYVREHRWGVWDRGAIATVAIAAVVIGLTVGWALQEWLTWAFATQTQRGY
jgi:Na+-driven multidrug efflux pump